MVVELAGIQAGEKVLDMGCGTGNLTLTARRTVGASGAGAARVEARMIAEFVTHCRYLAPIFKMIMKIIARGGDVKRAAQPTLGKQRGDDLPMDGQGVIVGQTNQRAHSTASMRILWVMGTNSRLI
jgi:hypothetical protein